MIPKNNHENRAKLAKHVVEVADLEDIIKQRIRELMHQFQSCQDDFDNCAVAYPEVLEVYAKEQTEEVSDE